MSTDFPLTENQFKATTTSDRIHRLESIYDKLQSQPKDFGNMCLHPELKEIWRTLARTRESPLV